jgi:hypothetical protein
MLLFLLLPLLLLLLLLPLLLVLGTHPFPVSCQTIALNDVRN